MDEEKLKAAMAWVIIRKKLSPEATLFYPNCLAQLDLYFELEKRLGKANL